MSTVTPDTVPPTASQVLENKKRFGQDTEDKVTEWEKCSIKKIFKKYDTDKSGFLSIEEVKFMMHDLKNDVENMGKVPNVNDDEIETMFDKWDKNNDDKISWQEFRDGCNSWQWRLLDRHEMDKRINYYFEEASRKKVQGNLKGALDIAFNALRLQG
jgi:Ca2+-binding EF-hand superfamily protein